jgi:hypothetical protein
VTSRSEPPRADLPERVSTLELFFDLVFVFTITQLTGILYRDVSLVSAGSGAAAVAARHGRVPGHRALDPAGLRPWRPAVVAMPAAAGIALLTAMVAGALAVERRTRRATVEA